MIGVCSSVLALVASLVVAIIPPNPAATAEQVSAYQGMCYLFAVFSSFGVVAFLGFPAQKFQ
jgi:hypothetical protein